jgi:hypothetical protein
MTAVPGKTAKAAVLRMSSCLILGAMRSVKVPNGEYQHVWPLARPMLGGELIKVMFCFISKASESLQVFLGRY